jgi:hypothetical protein
VFCGLGFAPAREDDDIFISAVFYQNILLGKIVFNGFTKS